MINNNNMLYLIRQVNLSVVLIDIIIFSRGKNNGGDTVSTGMVNPMWQAEVVGRPLKTPGTLTTADEQFALAA